MLIVLLIAWRVHASLGPDAVIPDARFSLRNFFELLFEGIASLAHDAIGHDWRKYMPLLATLGIFILIGNLMGIDARARRTDLLRRDEPLLGDRLAFVTSEAGAIRATASSASSSTSRRDRSGWRRLCFRSRSSATWSASSR